MYVYVYLCISWRKGSREGWNLQSNFHIFLIQFYYLYLLQCLKLLLFSCFKELFLLLGLLFKNPDTVGFCNFA